MTMTMTHGSVSATGTAFGSNTGAGITGFLIRLRSAHIHKAWVEYLTYRQTLNALRGLSDAGLRDIGLERHELVAVARREAFGQ